MFVDSNNVVNGQTYYYAVVSYDHGDSELMVAPAECSKTITVNPETGEEKWVCGYSTGGWARSSRAYFGMESTGSNRCVGFGNNWNTNEEISIILWRRTFKSEFKPNSRRTWLDRHN